MSARLASPHRTVLRRAQALTWAVAALAHALAIACGAAPRTPPDHSNATSRLPELVQLVPAGVRVIVVLEPNQLVSESWSALSDAILDETELDAFEARTGVDLADLTEAVVGEREGSYLLLARGPRLDAAAVVARNGERMAPLHHAADEPFARRTGELAGVVHDLIALDRRTIVVTIGPGLPELAAVVARARDGRWPRDASAAMERPAVRELRREHHGGALALYMPEPVSLPEGTEVALLLAREQALSASISPEGDEVRVRVAMIGEFPPGADENFRALARSVARSDLGTAFGIEVGLPTLSVRADERRVELGMRLPAERVSAGLRLFFAEDMRELLGHPRGT